MCICEDAAVDYMYRSGNSFFAVGSVVGVSFGYSPEKEHIYQALKLRHLAIRLLETLEIRFVKMLTHFKDLITQ